jgi:hypothetical protein
MAPVGAQVPLAANVVVFAVIANATAKNKKRIGRGEFVILSFILLLL